LLGFLPQQHRPVFPFTVNDVVLTGRAGSVRFSPRTDDLALADQALTRIGIDHLGDRLFTELSGGEQQLVMLPRVLAQRPAIILLDEPISHLDLAYQARVMKVIRALVEEGITVVAILHDPNIAALHADHLVCLKDGRILEGGTGATLRPEVLEMIYDVQLTSLQFRGKTLVLPR
jgi:iron complex transport system ATP-binding protein